MKTNILGKLCPPHFAGSRLAALLVTLLLLLAPLGAVAAEDDGVAGYIVKRGGESGQVLTFTADDGTTPDNQTCWTLDTWISNNGAKGLIDKPQDISKVSFASSFANARPTSTSYWFYGLYNVKSIENLECLNTEKVTDMSYMFCDAFYNSNCIRQLDLSKFNTANVTNMSHMFYNCFSETTHDKSDSTHYVAQLNISSFNTANVTDMSGMFGGNEKLGTPDLSSFNTTNVTDMSGMFKDCKKITELDLRSFNTANVTNMSSMFENCNKLDSLKLGENFTTASVTDMSSMFCGCKLKTLDLNGFNTANVTDMYAMFFNCLELTELDLSRFNTAKVARMDSMFCRCQKLTALDLSSFNTENVTEMDYMFYECKALPTITFGNNFNTSNVTDMSYMFNGCNGLTSLNLSNFNTANVTTMLMMFYGCQKLTALDLSNFNTANVTGNGMQGMFMNCSSLKGLDLRSFNTSNVTMLTNMFRDCSSLESLDLSSFNTSNVTRMDSLFCRCSSLTELNLSNFDTHKVFMMFGMFNKCSKLETLDISYFCTDNVKNIKRMFGGCTSLKTLNLGNNCFMGISEINKSDAFGGGRIGNVGEVDAYVTNCNLIVGTGFDKSVLGTADESGVYTWLNGTFTLQPLTVDEENKGAFTAGTVSGIEYEKVVLKRTFNSGAWNTLVVPFDITAEEAEVAFGGDVKIANYKGATENADGYTLNFEQVETESAAAVSPTVITAHTPVFIYGVAPSTDGYTFTNKTIKAGTPTQKADKVDFVGTYTAGNVAVGDYFIAADNNFYRAADASNTIRATRATFRPVGTASAAKIAGFVIDGETTAINQPAMTGTAADGAAYNLQGQRVGNGYKGVVIQNGRKYVRK